MNKEYLSIIDFPAKVKFKRRKNRIYTIMDFDDGEEIELFSSAGVPSSCAAGYAMYMSNDKGIRLTHINDLEDISCDENKSSAQGVKNE